MLNINRINEICNNLDVDTYGKGCNFINADDGIITFYSRDYCRNISFNELIRWYLGRIDLIDEEDLESDVIPSYLNHRYDLFMELIDFYSNYRILEKLSK